MCFLGAIFACGTDTCTVFALISALRPLFGGIPPLVLLLDFIPGVQRHLLIRKCVFKTFLCCTYLIFIQHNFYYIRWT